MIGGLLVDWCLGTMRGGVGTVPKLWTEAACTLASMTQNAQLYQGIDYGAGVDRGVCPSVALPPRLNEPMPLVPVSAPCAGTGS
jgi:hypothetical protein